MSINKDQVKGRFEEVKGVIKETTGKVVGNPSLQVKGNVEKNMGKARAKAGDLGRDLKDSQK